MRGRSGGVALPLLAATTVFVTAGLSNPALTDGRAGIEPPPPPPRMQTCIAGVGTSMATTADGQLCAQDLQYVSCDQPHQGEVFSVHEPMQTQDPSTPDAPSLCTEPGKDAWSYLGASPIADGEWIPLLQFGITLVPPSDRHQAAGQNWWAYVLTYAWDDSIELSESVRGCRLVVVATAAISRLRRPTVQADHGHVTSWRPEGRRWTYAGASLSTGVLVAAGLFLGSGTHISGVASAARTDDSTSQLKDRLSVFDRPFTDVDTLSRSFQESLDTFPGAQDTRRSIDIGDSGWFLGLKGDHLCIIYAETKASGGSACTTATRVLHDRYMVSVSSTDRDAKVLIGIVLLDDCHLADIDTTHLWQQNNLAVLAVDPSLEGFAATLQCLDEPQLALSIPTQPR